MKCPACGFESADDAAWCDFCKEPFRKKPAEPSAAPPPPAAPAPSGPPPAGHIPDEFAHLDPGERVPVLPPSVRYAAWAFLAIWFIFGMMVMGYWLGRKKAADEPAPAPVSGQ